MSFASIWRKQTGADTTHTNIPKNKVAREKWTQFHTVTKTQSKRLRNLKDRVADSLFNKNLSVDECITKHFPTLYRSAKLTHLCSDKLTHQYY